MSTYQFSVVSLDDGTFAVADPFSGSNVLVPCCCMEHCLQFLQTACSQFAQFTGAEQRPYKYQVMRYIRDLVKDPAKLDALAAKAAELPLPENVQLDFFDPAKGCPVHSKSVH